MIYHDMPYSEYAALPGWRWSHIKLLDRKSPRHVRHAVDHPDDGDTAARGQARAIHTLVFEPELFESEYSIFAKVRNKKSSAYQAHIDEHPGTTVLSPREHEAARRTADAIRANPLIAPYLAKGKGEVSITWTDEATGLECKGRIDWLSKVGPAMIDLKNMGTTNERDCRAIIARNSWHAQAAHYLDGLRAHGFACQSMIITAETKAPYDTALFQLHEDRALYAGREHRARLMERLAQCVEADQWPGRHEDVSEIDVPVFAYPPDEEIYKLDEE